MTTDDTPQLDPRSASELLADLQARLPAYVPGWRPAGAGAAVNQVFARYQALLAHAINRAPDKNKLAFLDMLGVNLLPAEPARAPVIFQPLPNAGDSRVPEGARLSAAPAEGQEQVVFEAERSIALASARLAEVVSLWPGRDAYADHSTDAIGGQPFTLFEPLRRIHHELYLAHPVHFALAGRAVVELRVELAEPGSSPLPLIWEHWDGAGWRAFTLFAPADQAGRSFDGTASLTRSGVIRLVSECAESKPTTIDGIISYWLRARAAQPLPPQPGRRSTLVRRIRIASMVDCALPEKCSGGIAPEYALADQAQLDISKTFLPFGQQPQLGSSFYFTSEDAFGKPGALVTICFERAKTPQDEADEKSEKYKINVNDANAVITQIKNTVNQMISVLQALIDANGLLDTNTLVSTLYPPDQPEKWYDDLKTHIRSARDAITLAIPAALGVLAPLVPPGIIPTPNPPLALAEAAVLLGLAIAARELTDPTAPGTQLSNLITTIQQLQQVDPADIPTAVTAISNLIAAIKNLVNPTQWPIYGDQLPNFFADAETHYNALLSRITAANQEVKKAIAAAQKVLALLGTLTPTQAAATQGHLPPTMDVPLLAWEYWDGARWSALVAPRASDPKGNSSSNDPYNLLASGQVSFTVPADWERSEVGGQSGRWARARILSGHYANLRVVSWTDQSGIVNFVPIVEPRPPALNSFFLGYTYASGLAAPEYCLSYGDFQWEDHTEVVRSLEGSFTPFRPVADSTPALYLGFDRALPTDRVSLYFDIEELAGHTSGPALRWEYWDGSDWSPLSVEDATGGLARSGVVAAIWPGTPPPMTARVLAASGTQVQLADARAVARFLPGDRVFIMQEDRGELAIVAASAGDMITLKRPLGQEYTSASIGRAGLARFGVPHTWLRVRLAQDAQPPRSRLSGIFVNAVEALQAQTIERELLGSGNGQPLQTFFMRQTPVLDGEVIEVRELEGARAALEVEPLRQDVLAQGMRDEDVRAVTDSQGRVVEVWVRWQLRPHLLFSGPDDRHYTLDRSRGRVAFGDGQHGRTPPPGNDNIQALRYRSGGGASGNVAIGAITQLHSGVVALGVVNPRAAEGGADGERVEIIQPGGTSAAGTSAMVRAPVLARGPRLMRHRRQALSADDYEALAREASPAVAVAQALPNQHPGGYAAPGWVTVVIVPLSQEPQPQPSFELRRRIQQTLAARTPAAVSGHIAVVGPRYLPIGVDATVVPLRSSAPGPLLERVRQALSAFLHPLGGGPQGNGWPFGRDLALSDIAGLVESIPGLDVVATITLLLDGTPQGNLIGVPPGWMVAAGPLRLRLMGSEP